MSELSGVVDLYRRLGVVFGATRQAEFAKLIFSPPDFFRSSDQQEIYRAMWSDFLPAFSGLVRDGTISADEGFRLVSILNYRYLYNSDEALDSIQNAKQVIVSEWLRERQLVHDGSGTDAGGTCFVFNSLGADVESEMCLPFIRASISLGKSFPVSIVLLNQASPPDLPNWAVNCRLVNLSSSSLIQKLAFIRQEKFRAVFFANDTTCKVSEQSIIATARAAPRQAIHQASCVSMRAAGTQTFFMGEALASMVSNESFTEGIIKTPGIGVYLDPRVIREAESLRRARVKTTVVRKALISGANFYKISPRSLTIWSRILRRDPECSLTLTPFNRAVPSSARSLFIEHVRAFFQASGIDSGRIKILDYVGSRVDYLRALSGYAYFLDSVPFSSGNGALDARLVGLQVLTRSGANFRGSLAAAVNKIFQSTIDTAVSDDALIDLTISRLKECPYGMAHHPILPFDIGECVMYGQSLEDKLSYAFNGFIEGI